MGLNIIVPDANFADIAIGRILGVPHSPSHIFRTNTSSAVATTNFVSNAVEGAIAGTPTFAANSAIVDNSNRIKFGTGNEGDTTVAIIVKNIASPSGNSMPLGNFTSGAVNDGTGYFMYKSSGGNIAFEVTRHPIAGGSSLGTTRTDLSIAGSDYEMFFGVMEDEVALRLYHPRTSGLDETSVLSGEVFTSPSQANQYEAVPEGYTSAEAQELVMFGKWPSVLTTQQMIDVYQSEKARYAALGLEI